MPIAFALWALPMASPLWAAEGPTAEATLARYEARYRDEALGTASQLMHLHDQNRDGVISRGEIERKAEALEIEVNGPDQGSAGTRTIRVLQRYHSLSGFDLIDTNRDGKLSSQELAARVLLDGDSNNDGQLGPWDYALNGFPNLNARHQSSRAQLLAERSDFLALPEPDRPRPPAVPSSRPAPPR